MTTADQNESKEPPRIPARAEVAPIRAQRSRLWPVVRVIVLAVALLVGYATWRVLETFDFSSESDARSIQAEVDPSLSAQGAAPLGTSPSSDASFPYNVEVTKQALPDGRLYVLVMEWREDWHRVELWITFPNGEHPRTRSLVHWSEDSGGSNGWVHNLSGTVRVSVPTSSASADSARTTASLILEYNLMGIQRGHPVTVRRKVAV